MYSNMAVKSILVQIGLIWVYLSTIGLVMSLAQSSHTHRGRENVFDQFLEFAAKYQKSYLSNSSELLARFEIYKSNVDLARELNKVYNDSQSAVYGVNKFADLTPGEFRAQYLAGLKTPHEVKRIHQVELSDFRKLGLPPKVDWRLKNVLTPVKDQKTCGACWSFSTVETTESMYAIQFNKSAPVLSVQEVIDCDTGASGCNGGDICEACEWMSQNGVVHNSKYPLTDHTGKCKKLPNSTERIYVKDYNCDNFKGKESGILKLLAEHGPVAVAIDAQTWHNYIGGIIQYHCSNHVNHAVQIVGYDLTGDVPFYIIRNSWGSDFGDKGYLYVKYGDNMCGLASEVASLEVKS